MRNSLLLTIFCWFVVQESIQKSSPEDDSYVAAVVEFKLTSDSSVALKEYVQYIKNAAEQNADIIVFPEMTLVRKLEVVKVPFHGLLREYPIPALHPELYDEPIVAISKAARDNKIYVVINVQEEMDCNNAPGEFCPKKKLYIFNTNVVFDRNGAVIDRYRKINLFGEWTRYPALKPELGLFDTDFGVRFGHFICFDLMFQVPAVQIVEKNNITNVILSTMWFSEMPYLTAVQIQESYAYSMNVNFLASGANNIAVGTAGSGIYSGRAGALISVMPGVPTTRLLVARVPKVPGKISGKYPGPIFDNPAETDSLLLIKDPSLLKRVSKIMTPGFQEINLVDKEVSCKITARISQRKGETAHYYRAFIQDRSNTYAKRKIGVAACAVVACKDNDINSCPYRFTKDEMNVEFEELRIEMTTYRHHYNKSLNCDDVVYFPISLRNNKFPLSPVNFTFVDSSQKGWEQNNFGRGRITYELKSRQNELISFGIWGRIYNKDVNAIRDISDEDRKKYIEIENTIYNAPNII
ncbi:vanin-like protein 2 isoform X1 [Galleria mellonella]|uniref:Vanin-like protein 2 isoform X1 n=1 Tax=Galleria mellonella TaxID=7137 RepID=A0ABM3MLP3_GALME|nr:vanin-like protein 2 isoform X1 [Galleria mellonella]